MKKILLFLLFSITIFLSSCSTSDDTSYDEFKLLQASKYSDVESFENKYVIYYYDSTSNFSDEIKDEILDFFYGFDLLDFYLVDVNKVEGVTSLSELKYTPSIVIMSDKELNKVYSGVDEIRGFITEYADLTLDFDTFSNQHLETYDEALDINNDSYILYYYQESCTPCTEVEDQVLEWAFTKNIEDVYFMNSVDLSSIEDLPTELTEINSEMPMILVMSYGEFTEEYYTGVDQINSYIQSIGNGVITSAFELPDLDYDDFEEFHLDSYNDAKTIISELHIEYFYSPTCSHCQAVKEDILDMFYVLDEVPYYFLDASSIVLGTRPNEYSGTPTIFIVKDGQIKAQFRGSIEVRDFIDSYNEGLIDFSQYE